MLPKAAVPVLAFAFVLLAIAVLHNQDTDNVHSCAQVE